MARLPAEGGLVEEAREPLLEAALLLGRAPAVENRLPDPASWDDALRQPLSHCRKDALPVVKATRC